MGLSNKDLNNLKLPTIKELLEHISKIENQLDYFRRLKISEKRKNIIKKLLENK